MDPRTKRFLEDQKHLLEGQLREYRHKLEHKHNQYREEVEELKIEIEEMEVILNDLIKLGA